MTVVLVTGGFDPLHSGHIEYFKAARSLGDLLIVGINSDSWLERKKGQAFMTWQERASVISNLKMVGHVIAFDDADGSASDAIIQVKKLYPHDQVVFANGGDRTKTNIPEMSVDGVEFMFGVGGDTKLNSSSWILDNWKAPKTPRPWGYYRILHENGREIKVKELTVDSSCCISMQRHEHRSELWFVVEGTASVYTMEDNCVTFVNDYVKFNTITVEKGQWHKLCNQQDCALKIIEIQYGDFCEESDIQRI